MKKTSMVAVLVGLLAASGADNGFTQPGRQQQEPKSAPRIVPNATAEMQTPEFWISRIANPDKVILTPEQIVALNKKNSTRDTHFTDAFGNPFSIDEPVESRDRIGIMYHVEDPLKYTSFPSDSLKFRIERHNTWFRDAKMFDLRMVAMDDDVKQAIIDNTNVSAIPSGSVRPQYGIIVRHTLGRMMPWDFPASGRSGNLTDGLQAGLIDFGQPVAILHVSKDGRWYYVRSEISFNWIQADNVALATPDAIRSYIDSKDFIVPTCHKVPIYSNSDFKVFLVDFYMGAKVKLEEKTGAGYRVTYPYRKADGSFGTAQGWVKPDAQVSVGYQPFTQRNVINTMFSVLYRPYGWADSWNERDCCGTIRGVLRSCGIYTGRWTSHQLHASDHVVMFPKDTPKEKKYEFLKGVEPGITLVGDGGHISMYLGEVNGHQYVIHQSGYSYNDENGERLTVRRVNVNDTELDGGSNIGQWTEITTIKP